MKVKDEDKQQKRWEDIRFYGIAIFCLLLLSLFINKVADLSQAKETYYIERPNVITELGGFHIGANLSHHTDKRVIKRADGNRYQYQRYTLTTDIGNRITHVMEISIKPATTEIMAELLFTRLKRETLKQLNVVHVDPDLWGVDGRGYLINGDVTLEIGYKRNSFIEFESITLYAIVKDSSTTYVPPLLK